MSTAEQEADTADLMHVADCARIPRSIMTFLIQEELLGSIADIRLIVADDVISIRQLYHDEHEDDPNKQRIWTKMTTGRFKFMIEWFNSYHRTYGRAPDIQDVQQESFKTLPEEIELSLERNTFEDHQ
jgi:hypothetical protein